MIKDTDSDIGNEQSHIFYSQPFSSKRIRTSPQQILQEEDVNNCGSRSPLGLKLDISQDFINLVDSKVNKTLAKIDSEKLKASNISATFLKIGNWEVVSRTEGHLVAKCYYAKKKIVWEILEGALKRKIEIQWADIIGIDAVIKDNEPGILLIELGSPPAFYRETNPQPRKHTMWHQASDFTGGQAPLHRRHLLVFPPGVLDKHYEKLLQHDKRLFGLSQKSFPTESNEYFYSNLCSYPSYFNNFSGYGNKPLAFSHYDQNSIIQITPALMCNVDASSPMSVMDFSNVDVAERKHLILNEQRNMMYNPCVNNIEGQPRTYIEIQDQSTGNFMYQDFQQISSGEGLEMITTNPEILINEIENHLLNGSDVFGTDETSLLTRVSSLNSFLESGRNVTVPSNSGTIIENQIMRSYGCLASQDYEFRCDYEDDANMMMKLQK